jgi:hypothetical protein
MDARIKSAHDGLWKDEANRPLNFRFALSAVDALLAPAQGEFFT